MVYLRSQNRNNQPSPAPDQNDTPRRVTRSSARQANANTAQQGTQARNASRRYASSSASTSSYHSASTHSATASGSSFSESDSEASSSLSRSPSAATLRQPAQQQRLPRLVTTQSTGRQQSRQTSGSESVDSFIAESDDDVEMTHASQSEASFESESEHEHSDAVSTSALSQVESDQSDSDDIEEDDEAGQLFIHQYATRLADALDAPNLSRQEQLNRIYGQPVANEVWNSLLSHVDRATEKIAQQYLSLIREVIALGNDANMPPDVFFTVVCQAQKCFDKIQSMPGLAQKLNQLSQGASPLSDTELAHIQSRFGVNTAERTQRITRLSAQRNQQNPAAAGSANNPTSLSVDLKTLKKHIHAIASFEQVLTQARTALQHNTLMGASGAKKIENTNAQLITLDGSLGLEDLIVSDVLKEQIERLVDRLTHPETYAANNIPAVNGILLSGEPGTGKTHTARIIASLATRAWQNSASTQPNDAPAFISCNGADFAGPFVGSGVQTMNRVIAEAQKHASPHSPTFLFIDEFDALAKDRRQSDNSREDDKTLNALLGALDGLVKTNHPIILLAATNHAEKIDPAARRPGRIDLVLRIDPPDSGQRFKLLKLFANKHIPEAVQPDDATLTELSENRYTKGYTGAALQELTLTLMRERIYRMNHNTPVSDTIALQDYLDATHLIKPSNVTAFPESVSLFNQTGNETQLPTLDDPLFDSEQSASLKQELQAFFNDNTANPFGVSPANKFFIHSRSQQRLTLAKAIAGTVKKPVFYADLRRLENKYIGESTTLMANLLEAADNFPVKPSVLLLDNLEYLAEVREENSLRQGMLSQLSQRLNDPESLRHLMVIGLSQKPATEVGALPQLFSRQLELQGPDESTRRSVLDQQLQLMPHLYHNIDTQLLARKSKNFDHGKLLDWVNEAKKLAGQRFESAPNKNDMNLMALPNEYKINMSDFENSQRAIEAKAELSPSIQALYG